MIYRFIKHNVMLLKLAYMRCSVHTKNCSQFVSQTNWYFVNQAELNSTDAH
jgi:hypothetical protein